MSRSVGAAERAHRVVVVVVRQVADPGVHHSARGATDAAGVGVHLQFFFSTDTSGLMSSWLCNCLIVLTRFEGSRWTTIQTPLTNTFVMPPAAREFSSKLSRRHSSKNSMTGAEYEPTEIVDISARFLTKPQAWPSGVSAGHTVPQCVSCN